MQSLGLLNAEDVARGFSHIAEVLTHGVLLCDLTTEVTGTRIPAVLRRAVTPAQRVTNIRKALEVLRSEAHMSHRCEAQRLTRTASATEAFLTAVQQCPVIAAMLEVFPTA